MQFVLTILSIWCSCVAMGSGITSEFIFIQTSSCHKQSVLILLDQALSWPLFLNKSKIRASPIKSEDIFQVYTHPRAEISGNVTDLPAGFRMRKQFLKIHGNAENDRLPDKSAGIPWIFKSYLPPGRSIGNVFAILCP